MSLPNIKIMVKQNLPFMPIGTTIVPGIGLTVDEKIDNIIIEQYYYLQSFTKKSDTDVEDETKYSNMQKMLIAQLVSYYFVSDGALQNVAGSAGSAGTAGKRIKKGKADVVEAEFDYGKSTDGTFLGGTTESFAMKFGQKACEYAAILKYKLPLCVDLGFCKIKSNPMPFMVFPNNNLNKC